MCKIDTKVTKRIPMPIITLLREVQVGSFVKSHFRFFQLSHKNLSNLTFDCGLAVTKDFFIEFLARDLHLIIKLL